MPSVSKTKKCPRCKRTKPRSEFHKDKRAKDGFLYQCKDCNKKHALNHYHANKDERMAVIAAWQGANLEKVAEIKRKSKRLSYKKDPRKDKARAAAAYAERYGVLIRPSVCEGCGADEFLERHHYLGYEKEHWLDVEYLCKRCHKKAEDS